MASLGFDLSTQYEEVKNCGISIANILETPLSCTKPLTTIYEIEMPCKPLLQKHWVVTNMCAIIIRIW